MRTELQQKQWEFLIDTITYYTSENRGVDLTKHGNACCYKKGCAIGRHIKDKGLIYELDFIGSISNISKDLFSKLPTSLQVLTKNFLYDIQNLHDAITNWDEYGITQQGIMNVKYIILSFNLNNL